MPAMFNHLGNCTFVGKITLQQIITVGIARFRGEHSRYYDCVFAASLLAILPRLVIFCLGQRSIISLTGLKG
jgi:ABC-type glycerol-3-phosphate transport system permease component